MTDVDDREHAIRQDERAQVLECVRRSVRAFYQDRALSEVHGDDLLDQLHRDVRHQLPGHAPGAA